MALNLLEGCQNPGINNTPVQQLPVNHFQPLYPMGFSTFRKGKRKQNQT
jgi:hypothetical protein